MPSSTHFWKKFYPYAIPLVAAIILRDAFVGFQFGRAADFASAFYHNLTAWMLWLSLAPGIAWVFQRIAVSPLSRGVPSLLVLAFSAAALHQLIHHLLTNSVFTVFRLGWGALTVSMLLAFLSALKLQEERKNAEILASNVEKRIEEARLVDVRTRVDAGRVLASLQEARKNTVSNPQWADQILTDLADQLRGALKSIADKLAPVASSANQSTPGKPRAIPWILYSTAAWLFVGVCLAGFRLVDDLYVWRTPLNWDGYLNSWLSWAGVAALAPFIFWMNRRFPIDRSHRSHILAHICGCILFWCFINITLRILLCRPCLHPGISRLSETIPNMLGIGLAWGFKFDVYGAVLLCASAVTNLELTKREQLRLSQLETMFVGAQLDALKMQLHPHFLYNALNSIVELIHQNPRQAADLLERLEQFLRITLLADGVHVVPLRKELHFADCYLAMQTARFPRRLSVRKDIDENSMESHVPVLILQPLIENAIRHGIARSPRPGEISIHSRLIDGALQLKIRDSGPGIANSVVPIQEGIGLSNTKRRLQHMYGNDFRFEIHNEDTGGLLVSLEIPCR